MENIALIRYRDSLLWTLGAVANCDNPAEYKNEVEDIMTELRINKRKFLTLSFKNKRYALRIKILYLFGFEVYCYLIRALGELRKVFK